MNFRLKELTILNGCFLLCRNCRILLGGIIFCDLVNFGEELQKKKVTKDIKDVYQHQHEQIETF